MNEDYERRRDYYNYSPALDEFVNKLSDLLNDTSDHIHLVDGMPYGIAVGIVATKLVQYIAAHAAINAGGNPLLIDDMAKLLIHTYNEVLRERGDDHV